MINLAAVVINYCDWESTVRCVKALKRCQSIAAVVVVDNASPNESYKELSNLSTSLNFHLLASNTNGGYGKGNNLGADFAINAINAKYLLILNPDVIITEEAVREILDLFEEHPDYKLLTPTVKDTEEITKNQGWQIRSFKQELIHMLPLIEKIFPPSTQPLSITKDGIMQYDCISGACLFIESNTFKTIGGYDPRMFLFYEENVLGQKLKAFNHITGVVSNATYTHIHSKTIKTIFPSLISRQRLLNDSRDVYIKNYFSISKPQKILYACLKKITYLNPFLVATKRVIYNGEFQYLKNLFRMRNSK